MRFKEARIPLDGKRKQSPAVNLDFYGSLFIFNNARFYAYEIVPDCRRYSELYDKVFSYIVQLGVEHEERLTPGRIRSDTQSISKWVWDRRADFVAKRIAFCEIQRQRAYRSHEARKRNNSTKIQAVRNQLRKAGEAITKTAIAKASGISTRSLSERKLKTDLSSVRSANAQQTHEIRKAATEAKIKQAIDPFLREGRKITQSAIAKEAGISRVAASKYYSHLFPKV